MADQRALDAIARIERALGRIESAADRAPSPAPDPEESASYRRLRAAHDALRRQVSGAIGQIDELIREGESR